MSTPSPDAFALKNSGLNAFLFSEVGTELNGSRLTILSTLARLGRDPWAEAAKWARLPKPAMIDALASSIAQMPLCTQALAEARITASRLSLLLPTSSATTRRVVGAPITASVLPQWAPMAFLCCAIAFGMAVNALLVQNASVPAPAQSAQAAGQTP